jgi:hypothetical protein
LKWNSCVPTVRNVAWPKISAKTETRAGGGEVIIIDWSIRLVGFKTGLAASAASASVV